MNLQLRVMEKHLEQVQKPFTIKQFKLMARAILQAHRIGLLDDNETLLLIYAYIKLVEEAQDAKGSNKGLRSRY